MFRFQYFLSDKSTIIIDLLNFHSRLCSHDSFSMLFIVAPTSNIHSSLSDFTTLPMRFIILPFTFIEIFIFKNILSKAFSRIVFELTCVLFTIFILLISSSMLCICKIISFIYYFISINISTSPLSYSIFPLSIIGSICCRIVFAFTIEIPINKIPIIKISIFKVNPCTFSNNNFFEIPPFKERNHWCISIVLFFYFNFSFRRLALFMNFLPFSTFYIVFYYRLIFASSTIWITAFVFLNLKFGWGNNQDGYRVGFLFSFLLKRVFDN